MRVLLVCEGSSDIGLMTHIQRLVVQSGYPEPEGATWTSGRRLADKVASALDNLGTFDLMFVHRDADRAGAAARQPEIERAVQQAQFNGLNVGVVPVRTTETWLILDEDAIRNIVRNPNGRMPLNLPTPGEAERISNPKATLERALLDASGTRGRRRDKLRHDIPEMRNRLLEELPAGGPLEQVESWVRFRDDTIEALRELGGQDILR